MSTRIKRLAVLGSGPSGLLVVHAAVRAGIPEILVWTRPKKPGGKTPARSPLYGCQYLHSRIPGIQIGQTTVEYQLRGTAEGYRDRVYGPDSNVRVSPEDFEGRHQAWNIRDAYSQLWDRYMLPGHRSVTPVPYRLTPATLPTVVRSHDLVISTIPAQTLCFSPNHVFERKEIWAAGDAPDLGIRAPIQVADDRIICNGNKQDTWYRVSRVFGMTTVEWPGSLQKPPAPKAVKVQKPVQTDCYCWADSIIRMGRYGRWKKGVLAHEVFRDATELLGAMK